MTDAQRIIISPIIVKLTDLSKDNIIAFRIEMTNADGVPVDISNEYFGMDICRSDGSILLSLGVEDGLMIANQGTICCEIDPTEAYLLDSDNTYQYYVIWYNSTFVYNRIISFGTIKIMRQNRTAL